MRFDPSIFMAPRSETPKQLRIAGALLLVLGLFIVVGSAGFVWLLLGISIPADWLPEGSRIDGTPGDGMSPYQRVMAWAFILLLLACGAAAMLQGFWQLFLGRKNRALLRIIIAATVVIVGAGIIASMVTGCPIGRICP